MNLDGRQDCANRTSVGCALGAPGVPSERPYRRAQGAPGVPSERPYRMLGRPSGGSTTRPTRTAKLRGPFLPFAIARFVTPFFPRRTDANWALHTSNHRRIVRALRSSGRANQDFHRARHPSRHRQTSQPAPSAACVACCVRCGTSWQGLRARLTADSRGDRSHRFSRGLRAPSDFPGAFSFQRSLPLQGVFPHTEFARLALRKRIDALPGRQSGASTGRSQRRRFHSLPGARGPAVAYAGAVPDGVPRWTGWLSG